jgi:hypothetical protein
MPELSAGGVFSVMPDVAAHVYVHIASVPTASGMLNSPAMRLATDWYYHEAARRHHLLCNATACMPPVYTQLSQAPGVAEQLGSAMLGGDRVSTDRTRRTAMRQAGITGITAETAAFHIAQVASSQARLGRLAGNVRVTQDYFAPPIEVARGTLACRIIPLPANQTAARATPGSFHGNIVDLGDALTDRVALHLGLPVEMLRPQAGRHSSESNSHDMLRRTLRGSRRSLESLMSILFDSIYGEQMRQTSAQDYTRRYNVCIAAVRRYMQELDMRVLARAAQNVQGVLREVRQGGGDGSGTTAAADSVGHEQPQEMQARKTLTNFLLHADGHNALSIAVATNGFNTMMNSLASTPALQDLSKDRRYQTELLRLLAKSMTHASRRSHLNTRSKLLPGLLRGADMNAPEVLVAVADAGMGTGAGAGGGAGGGAGASYNPKSNDARAVPHPAAASRATHRAPANGMDTQEFARKEAEVALDAGAIATFADPIAGLPFQPDGYADKAAAVRSNVRERLRAVEEESRAATGAKQRKDLTAAIQDIARIMQEDMFTAFEEAGRTSLGAFLENFKVVASIHDTDPSQNVFTLYEAGILTADALHERVAHQTGFGISELEVKPPAEVLACRNGDTMKSIMKKYSVDAATALQLMGIGNGAHAGAGAGGSATETKTKTKPSAGTDDSETEDDGRDDSDRRDKERAKSKKRSAETPNPLGESDSDEDSGGVGSRKPKQSAPVSQRNTGGGGKAGRGGGTAGPMPAAAR